MLLCVIAPNQDEGTPVSLGLALQQRENVLRRRIRLRERGHAGLHQDLSFGQVGCFGGEIGIADARLGSRCVGQLGLRQVDGVVELVLTSSNHGLRAAERGDRRCQSSDRGLRGA